MISSSKTALPVDALNLIPGAPLESILCTEELARRPTRPPDYQRENRALTTLATALVEPQSNVLQILAEVILDVTACDSSGVSLLTKGDGGRRFFWPAIAGMWKPHIGGGTPRDFGPCGDVLDQNRTLLFQRFERRYPYLLPVFPAAEECLLVPFYVAGKPVGTIWGIMHSDRRKFDAEDERIMGTLVHFASLAYQTLESIEDLKQQVAARQEAEWALRDLANGLESKFRRLVNANIVGIFIWNKDGVIRDANDAFLRLVEYNREDLASGRIHWRGITPDEWRYADDRHSAQLAETGIAQPYEKEYFRKGGSRVPVLVGAARFEDGSKEGVGFVVDLSDRKRSEALTREMERRYREIELELAHANRVSAMGQLSASIGHEVKQPIASAITNARAGLRWIESEPLDLDKVRQAFRRIEANGERAHEVIARIHNFMKKAEPSMDTMEVNKAILEVTALTSDEAMKNSVSVQTRLADELPHIEADRVQVQQVILNLVLNAIEAMGSYEGQELRTLLISTASTEPEGILVEIRDSGPGLSPEALERVFEPFYTTKPAGLGMGLSICRSIIEAHGGRLWAHSGLARGATFAFTLPVQTDGTDSFGA